MSKNRNIPLHEAILQNDPSAVQSLIRKGADINAQNKQGDTPLMKACKIKSSTDIIWYLLQAGADPNIPDKKKNIPIRFCLKNIELVQLLVEAGSDVNHRDDDNQTLLHLSAKPDVKTEVLAYLLEVGSDVNARDWNSATPLMYACQYKAGLEKTILLLSAGADPNNEDRDGNTVLNHCSPDLMEVLLEAGVDINGISSGYRPTALHMASARGDTAGVEKLLRFGADTEIEDRMGNSVINVIHSSSPHYDPERYNDILKLLIEAGANVNHMYTYVYTGSAKKESMLHKVVQQNNLTGLRLLLEAGADPYQVNSDGLVPMELTDDEDMILLLLSYMPALPPWWDEKYGELHDSIFLAREEAINTLATEEEIYDPNLQKSILKYLYY
jgi:ankyrin repeat protein